MLTSILLPSPAGFPAGGCRNGTQRIRDIESPRSCMQNQAPGYFELKLCAVFYWKTVPFLCGPRRGKKLSASPGGSESRPLRGGLGLGLGLGLAAVPCPVASQKMAVRPQVGEAQLAAMRYYVGQTDKIDGEFDPMTCTIKRPEGYEYARPSMFARCCSLLLLVGCCLVAGSPRFGKSSPLLLPGGATATVR